MISICHPNRMSLYDFFCLKPLTHTFSDVFNKFYSNNIKMWMNDCLCWKYDSILQWMFLPIPISLFLNGKIYCALATNSPVEIICASIVILFCSVYYSEMNLITQYPYVVVSDVLVEPYL